MTCSRPACLGFASRERRSCRFASIAAGLIAASVTSLAFGQGPPRSVVATRVVEEKVGGAQVAVGTVTPSKRSAVGSAVDGRVVDFPFNEGDFVKKSQPLAQLLIETIKLEVEAAKAELNFRRAELLELENGSLPEEKTQAKARMESAHALRKYAEAKRKRIEDLFKRGGVVTREELDETISTEDAAVSKHEETKAAYELVVKGPRQEKIKQVAARVKEQEAIVEKLQDQLGKHTIKAPFDGYVVAEHTEVGQWVNRGQLVAEVVALDYVDIRVNIPERSVTYLKKGMPIRIEVPALPEEINSRLPKDALIGQIEMIVPQADVRSRTFPVLIRVKNPANPLDATLPLLKAGMIARAVLPTGPERPTLLVSKDSIVLGGPSPLVYVIEKPVEKKGPDGSTITEWTVRAAPVTLGVAVRGLIEITGKVAKDDLVVVIGNERIFPGTPVVFSKIQDPEYAPERKAIPKQETR